MKTHIVCGSHRSPSQGIKISKFIASQIEKRGGQATVTDLSHDSLPLWDEGMWSGDLKWKPLWSPIETKLRSADSLVIVTPEYAGMASAAIKNFFFVLRRRLDRSQTCYVGRGICRTRRLLSYSRIAWF